jgi:hypothetical protein
MFLQVFQMHVSSVLCAFKRMLQVLHLDVWKVDQMLHLAPSSPLAASPRCLHLLSAPVGHPNQRRRQMPPLPFFSMLAAWRGMAGTGRLEWRGQALLSVGKDKYWAIPNLQVT